MKKHLTIFGVGALIAAVLVPVALASGPGRGGRGDFGDRDRGARLVELLGLSDAQAQELKALRHDMREDVRDLRDDIAAKRDAIEAALAAPSPDRKAIRALTRAIGDLHARIADVRVEFALAARGILTPEQFAKFVAHHKDMKARGGRGGHGPGGGGWHRGAGPDGPDGSGGPPEDGGEDFDGP